MSTFEYKVNDAEFMLNEILLEYDVIAPTVIQGKGRLSNTKLVTYAKIKSLDEIEFNKPTYFSAKSAIFPNRELMFLNDGDESIEKRSKERAVLIFMRSCDIHALKVLDLHFLEKSSPDKYYQEKRYKLKVCLMECSKAFENCFCVSMGTNKTQKYSMFIRKDKNSYSVKILDNIFLKYQKKEKVIEEIFPKFVEKDYRAVKIPDKINTSLFKDKMWKEYSQRCIACGRCNTSCPTCSCFSVEDIHEKDSKTESGLKKFFSPKENIEKSVRKRIWSSCQIKKFTRLAGNHEFRQDIGDRMRYKILHKIHDFKVSKGKNMCVGCGRCDDVCPEYISMLNSMKKINQIQEEL